jgi:hypothetical protein
VLDVHLSGRSGVELQSALLAVDRALPIVFVHENEQARRQALEERSTSNNSLKAMKAMKMLKKLAERFPVGR